MYLQADDHWAEFVDSPVEASKDNAKVATTGQPSKEKAKAANAGTKRKQLI